MSKLKQRDWVLKSFYFTIILKKIHHGESKNFKSTEKRFKSTETGENSVEIRAKTN